MSPRIYHIKETLSTNTYIRNKANQDNESNDLVVYSDIQSAGRGQRGNAWESEPYRNLTFSILIHPYFIPADQQFIISQIISLAISEALSVYTDGIQIKWPNDIYWNDKKICGILIENDLGEDCISRCIIGIGLNINQKEFVSDAPNPVSLSQITSREFVLEEILAQVVDSFFEKYEQLRDNPECRAEFQKAYHDSLYRSAGFYPYEDNEGVFRARIHQVSPTGFLTLEKEGSGLMKEYAFKEVRFLLHKTVRK